MLKKIEKNIKSILGLKLFNDGEDLNLGGSGGGDVGIESIEGVPDAFIKNAEYGTDEFGDFLKDDDDKLNRFDNKNENTESSDNDSDKGDEDNSSSEDDDIDSSDSEDNSTDEDNAGDDDSEGNEQDADEFADDVIPGFKGDDMKALSQDARQTLAEFYEKAQNTEKEFDGLKSELEELKAKQQSLLEDPIVKYRAENPNKEIPVQDVTDKELEWFEKNLGVDIYDDQKDTIKKGISVLAKSMANSMFNNYLQQNDIREKVSKSEEKALGVISDVMKSVKDWDLGDDFNIKELWAKGEKHSHWDKYKNGVGQFVDYLADKGFNYDQIGKAGKKELLAAFKASTGKDVEEVNKAIINERKKALEAFKVGKKTLNTGNKDTNRREARKSYEVEGIDVVALASDPDVYEKYASREPLNPEWQEKLERLHEKGVEIMSRPSHKKK